MSQFLTARPEFRAASEPLSEVSTETDDVHRLRDLGLSLILFDCSYARIRMQLPLDIQSKLFISLLIQKRFVAYSCWLGMQHILHRRSGILQSVKYRSSKRCLNWASLQSILQVTFKLIYNQLMAMVMPHQV